MSARREEKLWAGRFDKRLTKYQTWLHLWHRLKNAPIVSNVKKMTRLLMPHSDIYESESLPVSDSCVKVVVL